MVVRTSTDVHASVDHAPNGVRTILEFIKKDGDVGVVHRFFAFIRLKVAFGFVCFDFSIVDQYLVPGAVAVSGGCGNATCQFVVAFIASVSVHDDAAVSEPLMVHDLTDSKHRCSPFEVTHDGPQAVSPAQKSPGHFSIAYGA